MLQIATVARQTCKIIEGKPTLKKSTKLIFIPSFSIIPTVTIFADAPMTVPFPPRHAPRASAHQRIDAHSTSQNGPPTPIRSATTGSITMVKGILSKNAEAMAATQSITIAHTRRFSPKLSSMYSATSSSAQDCSRAPTQTKRKAKNARTAHSTSFSNALSIPISTSSTEPS